VPYRLAFRASLGIAFEHAALRAICEELPESARSSA